MTMSGTVDRRTFLRASGVALALPMLESMHPALARAAAASPKRLVTICSTLGLYSDSWFPQAAGAGYEPTEYLQLIDGHRSRYTLFSGYSHEDQTGRQPHNSEITWLTAARRPGLDGFRNLISLDQVAANQFGYATRFPSIVMGTATAQSQSFTTSGAMVPAEASPARLFRNLFLQGTPEEVAREAQSLNDGRQHPRPAQVADGGAAPARERHRPAEAGRVLRGGAHGRAGARRGQGLAAEAEAGRRRGAAGGHPEPRRPHRPRPGAVQPDAPDPGDRFVAGHQPHDPRPRRRAAGRGG